MEDFPPLAAIGAKTWADDGIEQEFIMLLASERPMRNSIEI
jgi:hypothetical protein